MAENDKKEGNEKKQGLGGIVSNVWNEAKDFCKKAFIIGAIATAPSIFNWIEPAHVPSAQVFTWTVTGGKGVANVIQNKPALDGLLYEGTVVGPTMSYILGKEFEGLDHLEAKVASDYGNINGKVAKAGTWLFAGQPAAVTSITALHYGLGKKFRDNWWPSVKRVFYILGPPSTVNILGPWGYFAKLAISGTLSFILGVMLAMRGEKGSIKNLYNAVNPFAYASATYSLGTKAVKNTFSYLSEGAYGLGEAIRGVFSGLKPKAGEKPAEQGAADFMKAPENNSKIRQYRKAA